MRPRCLLNHSPWFLGALHGVAIEYKKARDANTSAAAAGDNFGVTFNTRPILKGGGGSSTSFLPDQQGLSNTRHVQ